MTGDRPGAGDRQPTGTGPTVIVVDDHPVFRRGLASLLAEDGIDVLAQAGTVAEGMAAVAEHRPDVAILDLHLPDGSGVAAIRQIVSGHPEVRVLVLTMDSADATTLAALRAGARGYLLKETAAESIGRTVQALRTVIKAAASSERRRVLARIVELDERDAGHAL